jgi:hypothetical protein
VQLYKSGRRDTQGNLNLFNGYFRGIIVVNMSNAYTLLTYFIALVWLINGLLCKVLQFVPRHSEIVGEILNISNPLPVTIAIGLAETLLATWILTGKYRKPTAVLQILLVLTMNLIEFMFVSDMLLWGKMNLIFAIIFSAIIYVYGFKIKSVATT